MKIYGALFSLLCVQLLSASDQAKIFTIKSSIPGISVDLTYKRSDTGVFRTFTKKFDQAGEQEAKFNQGQLVLEKIHIAASMGSKYVGTAPLTYQLTDFDKESLKKGNTFSIDFDNKMHRFDFKIGQQFPAGGKEQTNIEKEGSTCEMQLQREKDARQRLTVENLELKKQIEQCKSQIKK